MTREELAKRILDGRGGWTRHETEAIREAIREFERATLERAAKTCDRLAADLAATSRQLDRDELGGPGQHFMSLANGAKDAARAICSLMEGA